MYNYDNEKPEWDYEAQDQRESEAYDRHIDAISHFPDEIFRAVMDLPTALAVIEGEKMVKREAANREIARSIWGDLSAS